MPEGDTVWLSAHRLHEALAGQRVVRSQFRVPSLAGADLAGSTVLEVVSRGKHVLARFGPEPAGASRGGDRAPPQAGSSIRAGQRRDARYWTLHTHFRMDGSWRLFRPGQPWRGGRPHEVRVVVTTDSAVAVGYRIPVVELLPTAEENRVVGHLGPDLLGPDWSSAEAVRRLQQHPTSEVGVALMDQRLLAGVGNVYKAECLFLAGLDPWTPVSEAPDLDALVRLAHRLLVANRNRWEQVTTGVNRRGEDHWVYGRAGMPCRRCGTPIRVAEQGPVPQERLTYWCPACQSRARR